MEFIETQPMRVRGRWQKIVQAASEHCDVVMVKDNKGLRCAVIHPSLGEYLGKIGSRMLSQEELAELASLEDGQDGVTIFSVLRKLAEKS